MIQSGRLLASVAVLRSFVKSVFVELHNFVKTVYCTGVFCLCETRFFILLFRFSLCRRFLCGKEAEPVRFGLRS